jgi:hypothetical protein
VNHGQCPKELLRRIRVDRQNDRLSPLPSELDHQSPRGTWWPFIVKDVVLERLPRKRPDRVRCQTGSGGQFS